MTEVADAGEDHRQVVFVRGGKVVEIGDWLPREKAIEYILDGHERFNKLLELE